MAVASESEQLAGRESLVVDDSKQQQPQVTAPTDTTAASAAAATTTKEPPPEKPSHVTRRTFVILSFWLIVLGLGLPIWWNTTSIYRANLPMDEMLAWGEGKACKPVFPLQISVQANALSKPDAQHLIRLTQHALDDLNDFSSHHLRLQLAVPEVGGSDSETVLKIRLEPGDTNSAVLIPHSPVLDVTYGPNTIPSPSATSSALAVYIADQLRSIFAEEQAVISYLLTTGIQSHEAAIQPMSPTSYSAAHEAESLAKRTQRSMRYSASYHLTFSLFTSGPIPSTWDVEAAIGDYLRPILDILGPIHNFTIDTQVQLYAEPGTQAQVLSQDDLASFINAAEWPLSPSIGGAPTLNFLIYVGNQTIGLGTEGRTSQSWLIPQWGTVYLLPLADTTEHVDAQQLKQPMLTFAGHLLSLLGTPESGSLPLRISTLSRIRSADVLMRASSTLGALARLAKALPSISIPSSVADGVAKTMKHLDLACATLGSPEGLHHARIAEEEAERAFFEKSMVGQLYFPDEHKIAVYLPLLGPVGVPLVIGLLNEAKAWLKRRRQRNTQEEGEESKKKI